MSDLSIQTLDPRMLSSLSRSSGMVDRLRPAGANPPSPSKADVGALLGEFQNVMFFEMMKAMRATVPQSDLFGKNTGREIFESFLDEKYAAAAGHGIGSLGLTEALRIQLGLGESPEMAPALPPAPEGGEDAWFLRMADALPAPAALANPAFPALFPAVPDIEK